LELKLRLGPKYSKLLSFPRHNSPFLAPDFDDHRPRDSPDPQKFNKMASSLSGSWHNIKSVAHERAKRWALGVHSSSVDAPCPVRTNGDMKSDVRKPLLSQTNSATDPITNGDLDRIDRVDMNAGDEWTASQGSIRVYWHQPETHL
jgi:hypothetical protein